MQAALDVPLAGAPFSAQKKNQAKQMIDYIDFQWNKSHQGSTAKKGDITILSDFRDASKAVLEQKEGPIC